MVALLFCVFSGMLCWLHYELVGANVLSSVRVWHMWLLCTLAGSAIDVYKHKDVELWAIWVVLVFGWASGLFSWTFSVHPLVDLTLKNLVVMLALLFVASRSETLLPILMHGVIVLAAFLASHGVIPSSGNRARQFLAFAYPDIAAGLQHASFIFLGGYMSVRKCIVGHRSHVGYSDKFHGSEIFPFSEKTRK